MEKYNLVVIGGGSAGLMAAAGAAGLGARVALVESGKMGGDCLNTGCVPSKALIASARAAAAVAAGGLGLAPGRADFSWQGISARVRSVIDGIAPHDSVERFQSLGVEVLQGRGRLLSPTRVAVTLPGGADVILDAKAIVIATGSSPAVPPIPGLAEAGYLTNETVFTHPTQPRRLAVLGAGPIGAELGQSFARLGSEVTMVEMAPRVLPREDPDAAEVLAASLRADGVRLLTGTLALRAEKNGAGKTVFCRPLENEGAAEEALEVDEILVATGRRPNTDGLGLAEAGVAHGRDGVRVDRRLRTSARTVYACGDVAGPYLFTHMAGQQARVVIQNALLPFKTRIDYRVVPWCTFTAPEVARVGLNETEAAERGIAHRVLKVDFASNDRAACDGDTQGFLKVLTPPGKDVILGATLVGAHAGDLIHELVLAMQAGVGLNRIAGTVHIYPTRAEIFRRIADESRKASFTPRLRRLFGAYLRWNRS